MNVFIFILSILYILIGFSHNIYNIAFFTSSIIFIGIYKKWFNYLLKYINIKIILIFTILAIGYLRIYDANWLNFDTSGLKAFLYTASRVVLGLYIAIGMALIGHSFISLFTKIQKISKPLQFTILITSFLLGGCLSNLFLSVLYFFGILNFYSSLIFLAFIFILLLINKGFLYYLQNLKYILNSNSLVTAAITSLVIFSTLLKVGQEGLYPFSGDADVWVSYLPYINESTLNSKFLDNPFWHHFYISKWNGLNLLMTFITDIYGTQILGISYYILIVILVYKISKKIGLNTQWSLISILILNLIFSVNFYKHHLYLSLYFTYYIYQVTRNKSSDERIEKILSASSSIISLYFGISQPLPAIFLLTFFIIYHLYILLKFRNKFISDIYAFIIPLLIGIVISFSINFTLTGLIEHAPMALIKFFSDYDNIISDFGRASINFLIYDQSKYSLSFDFSKILTILSLKNFYGILGLRFVLVIFLYFLYCVYRNKYTLEDYATRFFRLFFAFLVLALAVTPNNFDSVIRIFTFSGVIISIFISFLSFNFFSSNKDFNSSKYLPLVGSIFVSIAVLISTLGVFHSRYFNGNGYPAISTILGRISLKEAIKGDINLYSNIPSLNLLTSVKHKIGISQPILSLTQPSDPTVFAPGNGVYTFPSFSLLKDEDDAVYGDPQMAIDAYKRKDIYYFYLNLSTNQGLPYSPILQSKLFDQKNISQYLELYEKLDNIYILKIKDKSSDAKLPKDLLEILQLIRDDYLLYFFNKNDLLSVDINSIINNKNFNKSNINIKENINKLIISHLKYYNEKNLYNNIDNIIFNQVDINLNSILNNKEFFLSPNINKVILITSAIRSGILDTLKTKFGDNVTSHIIYNAPNTSNAYLNCNSFVCP